MFICSFYRQLNKVPQGFYALQQKSGLVSPALCQQINTRFNQLLNRYALLMQPVVD
ncbi:hypothetical protein [Photorhabdus stackebrandtii]|uniref:hypothetical protein n=1 Tax=Photorhabdus stackebrandtii TaxID=1123042 RepID=UPI00140DB3E3|nr:hypothetical protein [Photorhabdus stackebrandtii]